MVVWFDCGANKRVFITLSRRDGGRAHRVRRAVQDRQRHFDVQRLQLRARGAQGVYASTRDTLAMWSKSWVESFSQFRFMFGIRMSLS